jgi:hypothetical protein
MTDRAVRRIPKNEPPKMLTRVAWIIPMMKGKEVVYRGTKWEFRHAIHEPNLFEPS